MKKTLLTLYALLAFIAARSQPTWEVLTTNTTLDFMDIQCLGRDSLYFFGDDGLSLYSTNGGNTFITHTHPSYASIFSGFFLSPDTGFASMSGGVYKTTDGGANWILSNLCTCLVTSVCFANAQHGIYGGLTGVFNTSDGGATWSTTAQTPYSSPSRILALKDSVIIYPDGKRIFRSTNYGNNFHIDTLNYGSNSPISGMNFLTNTTGYICTGDGKILKTDDQGLTWNIIGNVGGTTRDIVFTDSQHGYLIMGTQNNTIVQTGDGGQHWYFEYQSSKSMERLEFDGHAVYAVGQGGVALRKIIWPTSTSNMTLEQGFVYPNPVADHLYLKNIPMESNVQIYSMQGSLMKEENNTKDIDLHDFTKGLYLLRIRSKEGRHQQIFAKE